MTEAVYLTLGGAAYGRVVYNPNAPAINGYQHVFLELTDALGSSTVIVDKDTSELVERTTYLAYGAVDSDYRPDRWATADPNSGSQDVFNEFREDYKFTGKEDDVEIGLTYFGARYYSPQLGRWISPDPLAIHGLSGDLNPYTYVGGHVTVDMDPFGLDDVAPDDITSIASTTTDETWEKNGYNDWELVWDPFHFSGYNVTTPALILPSNPGPTVGPDPSPTDFFGAPMLNDDISGRIAAMDAIELRQRSPYLAQLKEGAQRQEAALTIIAIGSAFLSPAAGEEVFAEHAAMRAELGLAQGEGALAKLEVGGREFWGINAHGQSVAPMTVNPISATHAETDAFAQAARAGVRGGWGKLTVDRALCPPCGVSGAVRSMAKQLGLDSLDIVTPEGSWTLSIGGK